MSPDIPGALQDLLEMIQQHSKDLAVLNTACARIERKQQRWLEILNLKDTGLSAAIDSPALQAGSDKSILAEATRLAGNNTRSPLSVGEPTED